MQYRVEDLAVLVLQNLQDITPEQLSTIIEYIDFSRCAYLKPVFDFARSFYEQYEKMPDEDYLTIQFESVFYKVPIPYHPQLIEDFMRIITAESVSVQAQRALQEGKYKKAIGIIQSADKTKVERILSMRDVLKLWKENRKEFSFGLKTAIPELDGLYKFLGYKTLNVFAAPPANFKTTLAVSMVMDAILNQKLNVVYITLEDTSEIIMHDLLAAFAGIKGIKVTAEEIKRYLLNESRLNLMDELVDLWEKEVEGKLAVLSARECDSFTPGEISKQLDAIYKNWGNQLDVVVVDHFNIMNDPIPGIQLQGPQLAKYYVRYMTNLAISFGHKGFILVGLAQINREGQLKLEKGKELNGSELADTSELHRSATTVTSLFADDTDRLNGIIRLKTVKNRLGAQGQTFMVPIQPEIFKVGSTQVSLNMMTPEEFEKLSSPSSSVDELLSGIGATLI